MHINLYNLNVSHYTFKLFCRRILSENNVVIDEVNGENEELSPALRYRALSPTTNRTMVHYINITFRFIRYALGV